VDGQSVLFLVAAAGRRITTPDVVQFRAIPPGAGRRLAPQGEEAKRGRELRSFVSDADGHRLICGGVIRHAKNGRMLLDLTERAEPITWLRGGQRILGRDWEKKTPLLLDERGIIFTQLEALTPYIGRQEGVRIVSNPEADGFIAYTPGKAAHWITLTEEGN